MEKRSLIYMRWGFVLAMVHVNIGRIDVLPDFLGIVLFIMALRAHEEMTVTEKRTEPLLWILAADFFIKWLTGFSNSIESLLVTVISIYAFYVLIGEVMRRIYEKQQETAEVLGGCRIAVVSLQMANYLLNPYGIEWLNGILAAAFLLLMLYFFIKTFAIVPLEEYDEQKMMETKGSI